MDVTELDRCLIDLLSIAEFRGIDRSLNGLQVGRRNPEVRRVACAVDAAQESFEKACDWHADMLFVHHGLYWGGLPALTGGTYQRVQFLLMHDLALYACHLPLDAHEHYGNNAGIANMLGLEDRQPFGEYKGRQIGLRGCLPKTESVEELTRRHFPSALRLLPFGRQEIKTVGIISGGAPFEVEQAIQQGLDLYITGDASHSIYHTCKEAGINVLFGGHYHTETFGVMSIGNYLRDEHGIETTFIDIPTGL